MRSWGRTIMITVPRGATSLQSRIILYLIPLLSILISMLTLLGMNMTRRGIMEQMQRDGVALARSYALSAENAIILGSGLGRVTGEASRSDSVRYLGITDDSKIVIAHTDISAIGKHYSHGSRRPSPALSPRYKSEQSPYQGCIASIQA